MYSQRARVANASVRRRDPWRRAAVKSAAIASAIGQADPSPLLAADGYGLLPAFLIRMRALPCGREALYLTYLATFLCDTAAYGVGRTLGRHPLAPRISPRKTREGAIGGLLAAIVAAEVARFWFAGFLSPLEALGFGVIVGVLGKSG